MGLPQYRKEKERENVKIQLWEFSRKGKGGGSQGVFFPAGVRVFPAGNLKNPQEILTKTLIIEQIQ